MYIASFFLPSHLSFKTCICTCTDYTCIYTCSAHVHVHVHVHVQRLHAYMYNVHVQRQHAYMYMYKVHVQRLHAYMYKVHVYYTFTTTLFCLPRNDSACVCHDCHISGHHVHGQVSARSGWGAAEEPWQVSGEEHPVCPHRSVVIHVYTYMYNHMHRAPFSDIERKK